MDCSPDLEGEANVNKLIKPGRQMARSDMPGRFILPS